MDECTKSKSNVGANEALRQAENGAIWRNRLNLNVTNDFFSTSLRFFLFHQVEPSS